MSRFDGSLARNLTFAQAPYPEGPAGLRLAQRGAILRGPDKYDVLAHRRRRAQIKVRRLLGLVEGR